MRGMLIHCEPYTSERSSNATCISLTLINGAVLNAMMNDMGRRW